MVDTPVPCTSAHTAQTSSVQVPIGSPVAFAVHPVPPASGIEVRNKEVLTLVLAPPPMAFLGDGQLTETDLVAALVDELTVLTYSTERT